MLKDSIKQLFDFTKQFAAGLSQKANGGEVKTKKLTSSRLVYVLQSLTSVSKTFLSCS